MGVYVFSSSALVERLQTLSPEHPDLDFGKHIIPSMLEKHALYAFPFDDYWVDVGTVDAYWQTSMELVSASRSLISMIPRGDSHAQRGARPVKTGSQGLIHESMVCNGCVVRVSGAFRAVTGVYVSRARWSRERVDEGYLVGPARCRPSIVDKNVVVGAGTHLGWGEDLDTPTARTRQVLLWHHHRG